MKHKKYLTLFLIALCIFFSGMIVRIETAYQGAKQVEINRLKQIDSLKNELANSRYKVN